MKRIASMGLCLVAAVAISLVGVASASAVEPEFGICKKEAGAATHEYTDAACTKLSVGGNTGKYKWLPGPNGTKGNFTAKTGAAALKTPALGSEVECKASSNKGKTLTDKTVKVEKLVFTGCKSNGEVCQGKPKGKPKAGTIETYTLNGKIGYINAAKNEVGTDLTGSGPGGLLAKFFCGPVEILTRGSVIGNTEGIINKKPAATHKEIFKEVGGVQDPEKLEGEPKDVLLTEFPGIAPGTEFESVQEASATVKGKLEIKA